MARWPTKLTSVLYIRLQIRRAFKFLITKEHPDKGGSPERFKLIKIAYDTLSDKQKVHASLSPAAEAQAKRICI